MISIVGLGTAASSIAEKFSNTSNYNVFQLSDKITRSSKFTWRASTDPGQEN